MTRASSRTAGPRPQSTERDRQDGLAAASLLVLVTLASGVPDRTARAQPLAYASAEATHEITIIDTATDMIVDHIALGDGNGPYGVAVSPDASRVYVTVPGPDRVLVIDAVDRTVIATVEVGVDPYGVAVNPTGTRAYVANGSDDTLSVIDTRSNIVLSTLDVGDEPTGVVVSPDGSRIYVSHHDDASVWAIDATTLVPVAATPLVPGGGPLGLAVHPSGEHVYVAGVDGLSVIDTTTNTVETTVGAGGEPYGLAVSPSGHEVYMSVAYAGGAPDLLWVMRTETNELAHSFRVGIAPRGVSVNLAGDRVYVANHQSGDISVIDPTDGEFRLSIPVGHQSTCLGQFIVPPEGPTASSGARPCRPGYDRVSDRLCIRREIIGPAAWGEAAGACAEEGARLCSTAELFAACKLSLVTIEAEWADDTTGSTGRAAVAGPTCEVLDFAADLPLNCRCCIDR
ncbi:MAG: YncE family protein [Acidobacteriota bacterium]